MTEVHYLTVDVYRPADGSDCTNGGLSSRFQKIKLYCPRSPFTFDADKAIPLNFCMAERRQIRHNNSVYVDIVPATVSHGRIVKRPGWWMYGGNIAHDSDCRFHEMTGTQYPVAIHDRQE